VPPKEDPAATLAYAYTMRDRTLKYIKEMHVVAQKAQLDFIKTPFLDARIAKLEYFVSQFRHEQGCVVKALVALDRLTELSTIDDPIITFMEFM